MNLEPTEEQLALRSTVRRFLSDHAPVAGHVRPLLDDPTATSGSDSLWSDLAQLGTTGVLVPEDHGGAGLTMVEAGLVAEELGRALYPGPWLSTAVAATRALTRLHPGDTETEPEAEVAKLLAGIADGSTVATVALTAPVEPTDPATDPTVDGGVVVPAARAPDPTLDGGSIPPSGEDAIEAFGSSARAPGAAPATTVTAGVRRACHVSLTSEEVDVPDAAAATTVLVVAGDGDDASLFAVDPSAPGVEITPQPGVDLTRPRFRVRLDGVAARRLGPMPAGAVQHLVDDVLTAWAADALGAAAAVCELAVDYAKVRTQFGRQIGAFQAVQHLCVDMYETVELARGGVMHALWAADRAGAEERHLAAVRAKAFAGRLATVGDIGIQVFGGIGFTWEHDAHLYLRRLLGWRAFLGPPGPYLQELGAHLARSASAAAPASQRPFRLDREP